jgi:hypothetical protein
MFTEVSALDQATVNSQLGPTTRKRQTQNTIIAKDGQMIVTGGLISDDVSESDDGVPYLKDIPVLGHAFKANSQARNQKNLLVFLTPRIVKDQYDARDITMEGRDLMEDVIANYGVEPKRESVLERESIDHVAESGAEYTGPKPGTIRPPKKAASRNTAPAQTEDGSIILDGSSNGVLDLAPKLPQRGTQGSADSEDITMDLSDPSSSDSALAFTEVTGNQVEISGEVDSSSLSKPSNSQAARRTEQVAPTAEIKGPRYLVLKLINKSDAQKELPFLLGNSSQTVGIVIPPESSAIAKKFFEPGGSYSYGWADQEIPVKVMGAFPSIPEAHAVNPGMSGGWYTLSPYEIMNLGKTPWMKR